MIVIEKGQWKGWEQTDEGWKKKFGKLEVESKGGFFYVKDRRYNTLKLCLEWET